jgi:hypothetical protein
MRYRLVGILGVTSTIAVLGLLVVHRTDTDQRTEQTSMIRTVDQPYTNGSKSVRSSVDIASLTPAMSSSTATATASLPVLKDDALLDGVVEENSAHVFGRAPSYLYRKLRAEEKDKDWSVRTEQALMSQLKAIPYLDKEPRVICGSTLCEIAGVLDPAASLANTNYAMGKLQRPELLTSGGQDSFDPVKLSVAFGISRSRPSASTFVRYAFRKARGDAPGY